jgi:hypothetical protein
MTNPHPAPEPRAAKPWWHPSLLAGPLFSFAFFAVGLLVLGWTPALVLLGFWLEEVLTFAGVGISSASIRRRHGGEKLGAGYAIVLFFPALHLIFIVVFMFIDSSSNPATDRLLEDLQDLVSGDVSYIDRETLLPLLQMIGFAVAAQVVEIVRRLRSASRDPGIAQLELDTRLKQALVLPHLTIIAGGGVMTLTQSGAWMAIGVVIAKAIVELLLFPAMRRSVEKERVAKAAKGDAG